MRECMCACCYSGDKDPEQEAVCRKKSELRPANSLQAELSGLNTGGEDRDEEVGKKKLRFIPESTSSLPLCLI